MGAAVSTLLGCRGQSHVLWAWIFTGAAKSWDLGQLHWVARFAYRSYRSYKSYQVCGKPVISRQAIGFCILEFRIMPPFRRCFMLRRSASCLPGVSSAVWLASLREALPSVLSSSWETCNLASSHRLLHCGVPHYAAVAAVLHAPKERFMPSRRFISRMAGFIARNAAIRPIQFAGNRNSLTSRQAPAAPRSKNFPLFFFPPLDFY